MKEVAVTRGQTKMHRAQVHNRKLKKALPTDLHKWLTADADRTCQQLVSELSPIAPPPPISWTFFSSTCRLEEPMRFKDPTIAILMAAP